MRVPSRPLWRLAGVIEAPADRVADLLLAVRAGRGSEHVGLVLSTEGPGAGGATEVRGGPGRFVAIFGGHRDASADVEVDRARRSLAVQGHFWYRGVYAIEPDPRGCRLTYRVESVAERVPTWLIRLWQFRFPAQMRRRFERLLGAVGHRLGCAARLDGSG
ncbi:MAG TPA: hypothetical protein VF234_03565 [Limnochordia bacterium]